MGISDPQPDFLHWMSLKEIVVLGFLGKLVLFPEALAFARLCPVRIECPCNGDTALHGLSEPFGKGQRHWASTQHQLASSAFFAFAGLGPGQELGEHLSENQNGPEPGAVSVQVHL